MSGSGTESPQARLPVDSGPRETRSLRRELLTLINVNNQKLVESGIERDNLDSKNVIGFRVEKKIYSLYHSLDRKSKALVKAILEKVIEEIAAKNSVSVNPAIANINIAISSPIQVQQVVVERAGVKELKEKLKKAENALLCVSSVLANHGYRYCDKKCVEEVLSCVGRYWR
jgi:hypothetical protein